MGNLATGTEKQGLALASGCFAEEEQQGSVLTDAGSGSLSFSEGNLIRMTIPFHSRKENTWSSLVGISIVKTLLLVAVLSDSRGVAFVRDKRWWIKFLGKVTLIPTIMAAFIEFDILLSLSFLVLVLQGIMFIVFFSGFLLVQCSIHLPAHVFPPLCASPLNLELLSTILNRQFQFQQRGNQSK
ncbi:hypothetical protein M5K25_016724 [Dendrobium thyrsiflorum]|uniref:Uncharacterized protein n=1 Tax=Dendrobium thyrsiflorum TaxID=117978 RepID=A0ABD0UKD1_DENTH